jgi:hypothetical protein
MQTRGINRNRTCRVIRWTLIEIKLVYMIWFEKNFSFANEWCKERTNVKLKQTITVKFSRLLVRFCFFWRFLKVYFNHDDDEEEQEGCCRDESQWKLQNNYITATERYSRAPARYTASLVKKLEELELVVRQLMHLPFLLLSEIMLRKEIWTVRNVIIRNYLQSGN